ncbi:TetR/AcrR family transcriptional regulator [Streptomyces sp. NPDC048290]|uniref:TetR/AcrR family transcriptional regulator n=1 Tax=Streptomyces sp. NPDC048290 TaxID=3155811 RepID=UPI003445EF1E
MDSADAVRDRALDAAGELFYARGVQAVGMDAVRAASGLSLKRLYQLFPSKEGLVEAYLDRRDAHWRGRLAAYVERHEDPRARILAVYDWLERWFAEDGFRGCAWINAYGELGAASPGVAERVRAHKAAFRDHLAVLVADAGRPPALVWPLFLLAEGAMVTAGIEGGTAPAARARDAARSLLDG